VTYEEGLDADEQQVKTGEIGIEQQVETQTAYILVPVDKQRVGERNISMMQSKSSCGAQQTKNLNID